MIASVDAGRLLKELDENWRALGKAGDAGVLRACAMTLIAVVYENEDPQSLGETLAAVAREHPNRTIVLRIRDSGGSVDARTSIQCWMPFGRRQQICCEQIELSAPHDRLAGVPPVLFGLMVADLPVAIWCRDPALAAAPELEPVLKLAGKLIVDSACAASAVQIAGPLSRLKESPWRLADLTWSRITRWRETVAKMLDSSPARELPKSGEITYAGQGIPASACYLRAWLSWALGCTATLRCEDPQPPPRGIGRMLSLRLTGGGRELTFRRTARTTLSIQDGAVETGAVFPVFTEAELLNGELGIFGRDSQFDEALNRFQESFQ